MIINIFDQFLLNLSFLKWEFGRTLEILSKNTTLLEANKVKKILLKLTWNLTIPIIVNLFYRYRLIEVFVSFFRAWQKFSDASFAWKNFKRHIYVLIVQNFAVIYVSEDG